MSEGREVVFGPFRLDLVRRRLQRGEEAIALTAKPMELLLTLVQGRDRVMSREELLRDVWPDAVVEEANLTQNISVLRKALGEEPGANAYIVTIPNRGYRFVARVEAASAAAPEAGQRPPRPRARLLVGLAMLASIALGAGAVVWLSPIIVRRAPPPPVVPGSIAVLPVQVDGFDTPAGPPGLALADDVIRGLAERGVAVKPTRSIAEFSDPQDDTPQEVGRALGVETVASIVVRDLVEGRQASLQLIATRDGSVRWSGTLEDAGAPRGGADPLGERLAERIAAALEANADVEP